MKVTAAQVKINGYFVWRYTVTDDKGKTRGTLTARQAERMVGPANRRLVAEAVATVYSNAKIEKMDCIYCICIVPFSDFNPNLDDNDGWAEVATHHHPDCEWVLTRGFRIFPNQI